MRIVLKWNNVGIAFIRGIDWDTKLHGNGWTVRRLLSDLYEKAGNLKHWGLIRMICGMLRKKVDELDAVSSSFPVSACKLIYIFSESGYYICFPLTGMLRFANSSETSNSWPSSWTKRENYFSVSVHTHIAAGTYVEQGGLRNKTGWVLVTWQEWCETMIQKRNFC